MVISSFRNHLAGIIFKVNHHLVFHKKNLEWLYSLTYFRWPLVVLRMAGCDRWWGDLDNLESRQTTLRGWRIPATICSRVVGLRQRSSIPAVRGQGWSELGWRSIRTDWAWVRLAGEEGSANGIWAELSSSHSRSSVLGVATADGRRRRVVKGDDVDCDSSTPVNCRWRPPQREREPDREDDDGLGRRRRGESDGERRQALG